MGRDTKYLTLAFIVLLGIASLIVLNTKPKNKSLSTTDGTEINTVTDLNDENPLNGDKPKGNQDFISDGGGTDQSYKDMKGNTTLVDATTITKPEAKTTPITPETRPADYDAPAVPPVIKEKLATKGGDVVKPRPTIAKPKEISEDTGPVYIVQTSVLASAATAEKAQATLQGKGYKSAGVFHSGANYLVYAGKFQNKESATELKKRLDKAKIPAFVKELR